MATRDALDLETGLQAAHLTTWALLHHFDTMIEPEELVSSFQNMLKTKAIRVGREDGTSTQGTGHRSATSTATSKPLTPNETDAEQRPEFFNLPREIRDLVYQYSVISVLQKHESSLCFCDVAPFYPTSRHPPNFLQTAKHCNAIDRWFYSVSLVSRQFAAEARAIFLQRYLSRVYHTINWTPLGCRLPARENFINALGSEATELRRLDLQLRINVRDKNGTIRTETKDTVEAKDAEYELECYRHVLHPNINIFLELTNCNTGTSSDRVATAYFHCTKGLEGAFAARKLDVDYGHWTFYKYNFFKTPKGKRDAMSKSRRHTTPGEPDKCDWNAWYG